MLRPSDFATFFTWVHNYRPFPWQQALVDHLAKANKWPSIIDIPTGAGKTSAIDIAVFHLALCSTDLTSSNLRISFVVNRRIIVDDAHRRAQSIADRLVFALDDKSDAPRAVRDIARSLCALAGPEEPPLRVQRLRGGAPLEHEWVRTPTQPTILCSTVDQIGSRLLFRGYGVSDRMKPVHAGLLGTNALILLDEAHISTPFQQTLDAIGQLGNTSLSVCSLTATPGVTDQDTFSLTRDDESHPILKSRLTTEKIVKLKRVRHAHLTSSTFAELAKQLRDSLLDKGVSNPAIGVVVNRVGLAREIAELLRNDELSDLLLLTGRARSIDRNQLEDALAPFRTDSEARENARALIVVATQCLEVGVDLDLDGLVSQVASFDALQQRFGRLNRSGRVIRNHPRAFGGIIVATPQDLRKDADPIYGQAARETWKMLQRSCSDNHIDFGVSALSRLSRNNESVAAALVPPLQSAPTLMPSYIRLLSFTSPRPMPDPSVELFLHGTNHESAGVAVAWRGDISEDLVDNNQSMAEIMKLVPPRQSEMIEIPIWAARRWLSGASLDETEELLSLADSPYLGHFDRPEEQVRQSYRRRAFRWAGYGDRRTEPIYPNQLRVGDVIVVPSSYGGCDEFGWNPICQDHVVDVADKAAKGYRKSRMAVRVTPDTVSDTDTWSDVVSVLSDDALSDPKNLLHSLQSIYATIQTDNENTERLRPIRDQLVELLEAGRDIGVHFPYPDGARSGAILFAGPHYRRVPQAAVPSTHPSTEDELLSLTSSRAVTIDEHCEEVGRAAQQYAQRLQLSEGICGDMYIAGKLHDIGKADLRYQNYLSNSDMWNRAPTPALAKSTQLQSTRRQQYWTLPQGWRHEALSVVLAQLHPLFEKCNDSNLVLWLIGTHHGFGRPFYSFADSQLSSSFLGVEPCLGVSEWVIPQDHYWPTSLQFQLQNSSWIDIFEQLKKKYGTWQLAHFEAIIRLADHRVSEGEASQ